MSLPRLKLFQFIVMLFFGSSSAFGQTLLKSGTVIAVYNSGDKIIVAADSRENSVDTACKITRLGNTAFFTASGLIVDESIAAQKAFSAYSEGTDIQTIGAQWANDAISTLDELAVKDPGRLAREAHVAPDGSLTVGIFGTNVGNKLQTFEVYIKLSGVKADPIKPGQTLPVFSHQMSGPIHGSKGYGDKDKSLIDDFLDGKTPGARADFEILIQKAKAAHYSVEDLEVAAVEGAVLYAIAHASDPDHIRGPVDVLELPSNGASSWKKIKPACFLVPDLLTLIRP
jgi:hypothetical protein